MPIYIDPQKPRPAERVISVYVDDSSCEIGGVIHTLLGGIAFHDERDAIGAVVKTKRKLGIKVSSEIKWNSRDFSKEQRHSITHEILPILNKTTGFLIVSENGKQHAALELAGQLSEFCRETNLCGFVLRFDKHIVRDSSGFDAHAYSLDPPCVGWTESDSAHDQLIQCADLFVGFQKLRIDFGLGRTDPGRVVEVEVYEGIRSEHELEWYVRLALRHSLWGVLSRNEYGEPNKDTVGYGVRIFSSIDEGLKAQALSHVEREFLGCIL